MRPRLAISLVLAMLAAPAPLAAQARSGGVAVITGTLLGADGAPMKLAHVHLYRPRTPGRYARTPASADGHFAIATTDSGAFQLKFTGVDHYATTVPLMLGAGERVALDVRLKHHTYADSFDSVRAVGEFTHFRSDSGRPLVRQPDGRYTLDVATSADTLAYQLWRADSGGRLGISGTQVARYSYRDGAGYYAVIGAQNGRATIEFDPGALRRVPGKLSIVFRDSTRGAARTARMMVAWNNRLTAFFDSANAVRARHDSLRYDWTPVVRELKSSLGRERDARIRQLLLFELMDATSIGGTGDTAIATRAITEIPPSSPWLALLPNAINNIWFGCRLAFGHKVPPAGPPDTVLTRRTLEEFDRIAAQHPDSDVQVEALSQAVFLARSLHDDARTNDYYTRLVTNYPQGATVAYVKSQLAPNRVLRVGVQIPDFHFAALDDSTVTYSRESMAGKTYLLEFWATWCGPCILEMKYLHAAHDSLASAGLEILSVSLDLRADSVRHFRQREWKMPWLHAFAPGGFENPQVRQMEIWGIPRAALVGKDGRILAVDDELRRDSLTATIRHALGTASSP